MNNATEQLISDVTGYLSEFVPIDYERTKSELSSIVSKYHVTAVEQDEIHPDLTEKVDMFLAAKQLEGMSPVTLKNYDLQLRIFADRVKKRAEDITVADIRTYLAQFPHLKSISIAGKLSILKSYFGWLVMEEFIDRDPTMKIKSPKPEKHMPKALSIEELEMLREGCITYRQRAMIEVLYATGCRLSEVYRLNREDIDFHTQSTNVIGKGNKEREVFFSFKAVYHLKKYLMTRLDEVDALIVTERKPHRRLTRRGIQCEVAKIARQAGLKKNVSPHVLRHTFATLTLNNGADIVAIQHFLGHSDPGTTQRYAVMNDQKKREQHRKYLVQ